MMYSTKELTDKINQAIDSIPLDIEPKGLYMPISYVLSMGGKRIRPLLMLLTYNMYKEDIETAMAAAIAVETYHNFTLLHDDLMDNADKRRGKATVHKVWDDNTAILSGDAMLILSYQLLSQSKENTLPFILPVFSKLAMEICEGQQYDMEFEDRTNVEAKEYLEMIKLKTSVLLAGSMKIGAVLAGATTEEQELLYEVGLYTGLAFQLKDDLLDVYGNIELFGKNIGGDILCNKKTYLLIKALEKANTKQKETLLYWIGLDQFNAKEKIEAVTNLYNELSIKEIVEEKINDLHQQALAKLEKVNLAIDKKQVLQQTINQLIHREV